MLEVLYTTLGNKYVFDDTRNMFDKFEKSECFLTFEKYIGI